MRDLTHVPAPNRPFADLGDTRPAARAAPGDEACDGSSQPCAPAALVRIYELEKEWSFSFWLCPAGAREMEAKRWTIRSHRAPPFDDLPCAAHRDGPCPMAT